MIGNSAELIHRTYHQFEQTTLHTTTVVLIVFGLQNLEIKTFIRMTNQSRCSGKGRTNRIDIILGQQEQL